MILLSATSRDDLDSYYLTGLQELLRSGDTRLLEAALSRVEAEATGEVRKNARRQLGTLGRGGPFPLISGDIVERRHVIFSNERRPVVEYVAWEVGPLVLGHALSRHVRTTEISEELFAELALEPGILTDFCCSPERIGEWLPACLGEGAVVLSGWVTQELINALQAFGSVSHGEEIDKLIAWLEGAVRTVEGLVLVVWWAG